MDDAGQQEGGGKREVSSAALPAIGLKPSDVAVIRDAMNGVTIAGTSAKVFAGAGYQSGGKTGTAQAVGARANEKYSAARVAEHLRDHYAVAIENGKSTPLPLEER